MRMLIKSWPLVAGALALGLTAAPVTVEFGGVVTKSAEARVFKGGSSQRVGSVNPADPGKLTNPVPNTSGGGKGGNGGGGKGGSGGGGGGGGGKGK